MADDTHHAIHSRSQVTVEMIDRVMHLIHGEQRIDAAVVIHHQA
jgi:hypothetical protein